MNKIKLSYGIAGCISILVFFIMIFCINEFLSKGISIFFTYHYILNLFPPLIFAIIFGSIGYFYEKRNRALSAFSIVFGIIFIILAGLWYLFSSSMIID